MSDWWESNAEYVKAYAAYILILFAFQTVAGFLFLRDRLTSLLKAAHVPETPSLWISSIAYWIAFVALGFFIFTFSSRGSWQAPDAVFRL